MSALLSLSSAAYAQNTNSAAATLPNGASSLTETYGLWRVHCGLQDGKKICSMSRQEVNDQNRIVVAAEIKLDANGTVSGDLLVPFGLLVSKPVHLRVDDGKTVIESAIRSCYPGGCLVPIAFDKNFIAALRSGKQLNLAMTLAVPGEPALNDLFIQLGGFSNALNRLAALQK